MDDSDRRKLTWILVLLDCVVVLVFLAMATSYASELDLPVLPPGDPRRVERKPGALPLPPPESVAPEPLPEPPVFFGEVVPLEARQSIVYVLDFSQSMGAVAERVDYRTTLSRWQVAKREACASISALSPGIKFGVVVFGTGRGCGVQAWQGGLVPATASSKEQALAWLGRFGSAMQDGGATPAGPAVVVGLELDPGVVVLLTDGAPSACGLLGAPWVSHRQLIETHNPERRTRIDVFGVGLPDSYAMHFARGVASDSGGTFVEIRSR